MDCNLLLIGKNYILKYIYFEAWLFLGHAEEEKSWETNDIINHMWPFTDCVSSWPSSLTGCRVHSFLLCHPRTLRSQLIMQTTSVSTQKGILHSHYLKLSFNKPLYAGTWNYCRIIYSSVFIQSIHHVYSMYGSCKLHQIYLPYFDRGTTNNLGHLW